MKFCWGEFIQSSDSLLGLCVIHFLWVLCKVFPPLPQRFSSFFCCSSTHFNPGKVWMWILWLPTPAKSLIDCRSWTASPSHALPRNSCRWMRLLVMSVTRRWQRGQCRLPDDQSDDPKSTGTDSSYSRKALDGLDRYFVTSKFKRASCLSDCNVLSCVYTTFFCTFICLWLLSFEHV